MAYREFTDDEGTRWRAWDVTSASLGEVATPNAFVAVLRGGWVVFESPAEKRRLSPIPDDWDSLADHELGELCRRAERTGARRSRVP
ncbi:MAG TPA: hypothetical protein VNA89_10305 [Gemmatimonadaceae bacterium]|nr:hypothetical protein [Gemmatimonadaceae bacterium]